MERKYAGAGGGTASRPGAGTRPVRQRPSRWPKTGSWTALTGFLYRLARASADRRGGTGEADIRPDW